MSAGLQVAVRFAPRDLDVALDLAPGEVLAVLGPNGAGKSTLLGLLSGLLRPTAGTVVLDGDVLVDTGRGVFVPAHRRGIALLAQQPLLFPHLDARANVAFGPRSRGRGRREAGAVADRWLGAVGVSAFARRRPHQLSGGQAQRVAVARALAAEPRLLLLDEPLAALDVAAAPEVRHVLRRVLRGDLSAGAPRSAVLVTHDPLDALALADRVVVVEAGRVVESGPVTDVLARPRSGFGARIAGRVLLTGTATATGVRLLQGTEVAGVLDADVVPGGPAVAVFSPTAVAVHVTDPGGSPRNRWRAVVTELAPRGDVVRLRATHGDAELLADITLAAAADLDLVPGREVHLVVKATAVGVHAVPGPTAG